MAKKRIQKQKPQQVKSDVVLLTLPLPVKIKMLAADGRSAGTLTLTEETMEYKRANQKKARREIRWKILDKLADLGIA